MRFIFFCSLIVLATCQTQVDPKTTPHPNSTTTAAPNTTTVDPKTTTADPKTTTAAPNTTTVAPKTTTVAPKTTTVAPKTTTPMPTPAKRKAPEVMSYNVTTKSLNATIACLKVEMATQIVVTYNNTMNKMETAYINLGKDTVVNRKKSHCDVDNKNQSMLELQINGNPANVLRFTVVNMTGTDQYVKTIELFYKTDSLLPLFSENDINVSKTNLTMFKSSKGKSYLCMSKEEETLTTKKDDFTVVLDVNNVKFDAFRTENSTVFRYAEVCPADDQVSDIVPIAVGIALAALVVIVLIAYFIGRRRSRRLAYQSV